MATPKLTLLKCDHCPSYYRRDTDVTFDWFEDESEAYKAGRKAGWYIAELELCPLCADAYALEKSNQEVRDED